ncbi:hypothetical protein CPB97_003987 [Podila verticillata]|nr:hypothetical protein CPB97_003987 [Podila verticillata]
MKTITFISALCVATFAQVQAQVPGLPTNPYAIASPNCGFYAGVSYMPPTSRQRHCKVSLEVQRPNDQGSPCVAGATKFQDLSKIATNKCAAFMDRKCHGTDQMPYGQICLGRAGNQDSDITVRNLLLDCVKYATGLPASSRWDVTCDEVAVPDYGRFRPDVVPS